MFKLYSIISALLNNSPCLVQVYTTLPPGINASATAYLHLNISLFRAAHRSFNTRRSTSSTRPPDDLSVRVRWWGEPVGGQCAIFNPRLAHKVGHKQTTCTRARYRVTVPLERFSAYLKDMRALYLDVLDDNCERAIGRARIDRIDRLTPNHPIDT
ncbi:uncharacterized protein DEA37_0007726 [Paragonimus westermani]|uniref:C2CD3 N-terminal C2 domain-containing protein n=1 Tax=Paragonimus westermani TaxID=34504 RepID=A0A5J4NT98_9TREM|nr:uncharacterized protein DEA37_0007726 [Paragonimus westermani]